MLIKRIIRYLAIRIIVEYVWMRSLVFGPPRLLVWTSPINLAILRRFGARVGEGVRVHPPLTLHAIENGYGNLIIGDGVFIGACCFMDLSGRIVFENGSGLGPGVKINTHNNFNYNEFLEKALAHQCGVKDVRICEGGRVKANALVLMGVTIGKNAVIAAGAVVNRDIPDNAFAVGIPAVVKNTISLPANGQD